jgi:predicted transposase YbfD/YdcC
MNEIDRDGVESIIGHFGLLPDPREERNRKHLLVDIIVIAVCGVIVGCEGPTAIERWAKAKKDWLDEFLELPNGIPSHDCVRRVLLALHPEAFQKCFENWITHCLLGEGEQESIGKSGPRHIAIDGKSLRRSHDKKSGLGPLHLVSAWAAEEGISLGQVATEEKSNEITAIPELLKQIDFKDTVVTIDAMGCQKKIAKQIVDGKGDFVLAVKENQPKLHDTIDTYFDSHWSDDDQFDGPLRQFETHDKGHGRVEDRFYFLAKLPKDHPIFSQWPGVKAIGMAIRICNKDGETTEDRRYYIVSRYLSGQRFAAAVRGHWGIENTLHWQLDVTFREDDSRVRHRRLTNNLAWLRRFAISLLKRHPSNHSIKGKAQIAGWNNDFLMEVLTDKQT